MGELVATRTCEDEHPRVRRRREHLVHGAGDAQPRELLRRRRREAREGGFPP